MPFYTILRFCVAPAFLLGWVIYQYFFNKKRDRQTLRTDLLYVALFLAAYGIMYYLLT